MASHRHHHHATVASPAGTTTTSNNSSNTNAAASSSGGSHQEEDFSVSIAASAIFTMAVADPSSPNSSPTTRAAAAAAAAQPAVPQHIIHAVTVTQPHQCWTVLRNHLDFLTMDVALGNLVEGFPNFPNTDTTASVGAIGGIQEDVILSARHTANTWLLSILQIPTVRNSTIMRQFLCYDANVVPVQFEGLAWIHFNTHTNNTTTNNGSAVMGSASGGGRVMAGGDADAAAGGGGRGCGSGNRSASVPHTPPQAALSYAAVTARGTSSLPPRPNSRTNLDEMEMDDMFTLDDEEEDDEDHGNPNEGEDGDEDDDDEDVHSIASYDNEDDDEEDDDDVKFDDDDAEYLQGRYEPTDETLSQSEIMEIQQDYSTVEMVEDVGSLAQSLGASHLGRSLNLQREYMAAAQARVQAQQQHHQHHPQNPLPSLVNQHPDNMIGGSGGIHIMDQGHNSTTNPAEQGSSSTRPSFGEGGIGEAMAMAAESGGSSTIPQAADISTATTQAHVQGIGDSFHRTAPVSAPKLDSFNMIKVIGKGSFGE